jgi:hypothetical protein
VYIDLAHILVQIVVMERGRTSSAEGVQLTDKPATGGTGTPLLAGAVVVQDGTTESRFAKDLERARKAAEAFGEHGLFSSMMSIVTIYTLYQSDIRLAATDKTADAGFTIVASIIFFVFLIEIFLQSFYKDDYCIIPKWAPEPDETWTETWSRRLQVGSFYFWLDWIATLTLIFDVSLTTWSCLCLVY